MPYPKKDFSGFTLVELAIVMMIIGLLIGGILKGQELLRNSRITGTIAQVNGISSAMVTFKDKYDALPGDMANANMRIPGCSAICVSTFPAGLSNSVIGDPAWGAGGFIPQTSAAQALQGANVGDETVLFWVHLLQADLISGVTRSALTGGGAMWTETHPAAKIGGGFVVGWGDGTRNPGAPAGTPGASGFLLALVRSPSIAMGIASGSQPMTPSYAAQIDRKMDDGRPNSGSVQAYGFTPSCFSGTAPNLTYRESTLNNDCGLIFLQAN